MECIQKSIVKSFQHIQKVDCDRNFDGYCMAIFGLTEISESK